MYNISPLFYKKLYSDRFINNLTISHEQKELLLSARRKIRKAIRAGFAGAREYLKSNMDIHDKDVEWISNIKPKFMTQGSFAYKTLNKPCCNTQEIDLDDGVYLPISIMGALPRQESIKWFFGIVDNALKQLCVAEGWKFSGEIDTCSRVIILGKQAHIDVPLYAIPDTRHEEMTEAINFMKAANRMLSDIIYGADSRDTQQYILHADDVNLATREHGWKKSDPLLIANWFKQEVSLKKLGAGERLRRICRFLKAWRDYVWESGGPSSLTLMICAVEAYPEDDKGRDDYALLEVVRKLPNKLNGEILNPAAKEREVVYPRGKVNCVEIVTAAKTLLNGLESALSGAHNGNYVIQVLRKEFGSRIPSDPGLIEVISSAEIVRSTPAKNVKADNIPNTRSG